MESRSCGGVEGFLIEGVVTIESSMMGPDGLLLVVISIESFISDMVVAFSRIMKVGVGLLFSIFLQILSRVG